MKAANEATSTASATTVTFDTLKAAKELRNNGFEDRQADAVVTTINKAMSETVATKADLELLGAATKADMELHRAATKADIESLGAATKADMELHRAATKADMESLGAATKADMELHRAATKADMRSLGQSVDNRFDRVDLKFEALEKSMVTLQDKIVIKLGALMVTMTFLLLALGPFYFRWVNSLMSSL